MPAAFKNINVCSVKGMLGIVNEPERQKRSTKIHRQLKEEWRGAVQRGRGRGSRFADPPALVGREEGCCVLQEHRAMSRGRPRRAWPLFWSGTSDPLQAPS